MVGVLERKGAKIMAKKKTTAAEPAPTVNLRGLMGRQIAEMIEDGEVTQASAEAFVAERAVHKLRKEIAKRQA